MKELAQEWVPKGHPENVRTRGLTLAALIFPLREGPEVVKADSASESSETSSEHHCRRADHAEQKGRVR